MVNRDFKVCLRTPVMDCRSRRISQLLPLVNLLCNVRNAELNTYAIPLQIAFRDCEKLNEIELACVQAVDNMNPSLWMRIQRILETP
jgi:hypothetical protein